MGKFGATPAPKPLVQIAEKSKAPCNFRAFGDFIARARSSHLQTRKAPKNLRVGLRLRGWAPSVGEGVAWASGRGIYARFLVGNSGSKRGAPN